MASAVHELNLTSMLGLQDAAAWIRSQLRISPRAAAMFELIIHLPVAGGGAPGRAAVFMDPTNAYIVGFRGRDAIYLLDENSEAAEAKLRAAGLLQPGEKPITLRGLKTSHRSLGTFGPRHGAGDQGRTFYLPDLCRAARLSEFSSQKDSTVSLDKVRDALSILVCMTSECARNFAVERAFERLYLDWEVKADDAMQSYDQAVRITRYAEVFHNDVLAYRIEKLEKRATEIEELFRSVELKGQDRQWLIRMVLLHPEEGRKPTNEEQRLREIVRELQLTEAHQVTEIVSLCRNKTAVRAAKGRVFV
jgi:hypothetical protein